MKYVLRSNGRKGFALLAAVIFMAVMLAFGLALSSLGYKQQVLASYAIKSQYAFYAADAGLECALYFDQQNAPSNTTAFPYSASVSTAPPFSCNGAVAAQSSGQSFNTATPATAYDIFTYKKIPIDTNRCVDIIVYKYQQPQSTAKYSTWIFSQGYDVSCSTLTTGARYSSRGLQAHS